MTDNIILTDEEKRQRHISSVKKYLNKRYCIDAEFRNKKSTEMRQRYQRTTIDCSKCKLRISKSKAINNMCPLCNRHEPDVTITEIKTDEI
jgi:hypothetical protein